ncbi:zinc finger protein 260-like [Culex pipiens pallens]|uniref:zinc finger protein 260-like n=1 Tax=Culex pipiens pallens TaxID=42434 RepID=UPI001954D63C|nr:zinc finger protein 260-like [Culex pipiens pallens]
MFEVCCRLCLEQVPLSRVQSLYDKHQDYTIRDKITELFQIEFSDTEKLSTVCNACLEKVETASKIRSFFIAANDRFRRIMLGCEDKKESKEPKKDEDSLVVKSVADTDDGDPEDVKMEPSESAEKIDTVAESEPVPSDQEEEEEHLVMLEEVAEEDSPDMSVSIYDGSEETGSEHKPDEEDEFELHEMEQEDGEDAVEVLSEVFSSEQGCDLEEEEQRSSNEVVELDEVIKRTVSIGAPGDEEFSVVMIEYQCNVCNEVFEDRVSLIRHTNGTHIKEYSKNCRHCLSVFRTDEELKEHDCIVKPRLFKCSKCNRSFQSVKELQDHTKISHRIYEIPITKPQPQARRSNTLNQCSHCPKSFANNRTLVRHVQDVHPETIQTILTCQRCEQQFANEASLQAHMAAHEKNYECRFCGKVCPTSVALAGHENTHTKDQPFQCNECGRNFAQYTSMRRHMKIHFNEKKYSCDLCPKLFRQRSVMLTHRRIHTGEKPFECGVCKKSFRDHSTLAKHRRVHEKDGPKRRKS